MNRIALIAGCLLAAAAMVGSPAMAAKHAARNTVSCKQIKDALASGKSEDDVAKDLKVSASRVKSCTAPTTKHHRKAAPKAS